MLTRLNSDTLLAIDDVVEQKMQNRESFFALDVTNQVKSLGYQATPPGNFGSHSQMAPEVARAVERKWWVHQYDKALVDVANGNEQAWLYFPKGTTTATLQSHVNRHVTPLIPVEVWAAQVSQQASGVQSQASPAGATVKASQPDSAAPPGKAATLGQHIRRLLSGN